MRVVFVGVILFIGLLYSTQVDTVSIYEIQYTNDPGGNSPLLDDTVATFGIVTAVFGSSFTVEEQPGGPWHGVYVYRAYDAQPAVMIGDSVYVMGVVNEYHSMTEINARYYGEVAIIRREVSLPETTVIGFADVEEEKFEGSLVLIKNVKFVESGVFEGNSLYHIIDTTGSETALVWIKNTTDIPGTPIPSGILDLVSIFSQYDHYELLPRSPEDFMGLLEENVGTKKKRSFVLSYPSQVKLSSDLIGSVIKIFDRTGKRILKMKVEKTSLSFNFPSGVYFYSVEKEKTTLRGKILFLR